MADDETGPGPHRTWETTAFVLGELGGQERADLVAHLEHCAVCQNEVASLSDTLDQLSGLVPPIIPSPGFVSGVLDALPADPSDPPSPLRAPLAGPPPQGRTSRRSRVAWVGTVVAAVFAATLGISVALHHTWGGSPSPDRAPAVAEMRTAGGSGVGQAVVFDQRPALVTVALDVPPGTPWSPGGPYKVLAIRRDGRSETLGSVVVVGGEGGLQARTQIPADDIATVKVLAPDGQNLCAGLLPPGPPPSRPPGP